MPYILLIVMLYPLAKSNLLYMHKYINTTLFLFYFIFFLQND